MTNTHFDPVSLNSSENEKCFRRICKGNKNTHVVIRNFFRKSCRLWDNVEKYCRAGQGTYGNMAHAHCMLGT